MRRSIVVALLLVMGQRVRLRRPDGSSCLVPPRLGDVRLGLGGVACSHPDASHRDPHGRRSAARPPGQTWRCSSRTSNAGLGGECAKSRAGAFP